MAARPAPRLWIQIIRFGSRSPERWCHSWRLSPKRLLSRWQAGRLPLKVLDIAAGHGMFGIAIGKAMPQAEIFALDWEPVLAVAKENAEKAGIGDRYRTIAGSAFEVDYGSDYDLVLLPNFLHHFDKETCVALLKKVKQSLSTNGKVLAVEFVPNEDRISPYMPACFAFVMLAHTPSGDAYTAAELDAMALAAGFKGSTTSLLANSPESLVTFES
jgi:2-polyprenyl-3-methyl-5-hydroxy-6-metoxy-1,4-benzoquinol methylase